MNINEFREYLSEFGSNLQNWPISIRQKALEALNNSKELQFLIKEEINFENILNQRKFESHSINLETRIISSINNNRFETKNVFEILKEVFSAFHLPKPSYALSLILLVGITLGYFVTNSDNLDNDVVLSEISFYDGDFYEFEN